MQGELNAINAALPVRLERVAVVEVVVITEEVVVVVVVMVETVVAEGLVTMVVEVVEAAAGVVAMELAAGVVAMELAAAEVVVEEVVLMVAERIAVMLRFLLRHLPPMVAWVEITHLPQIHTVEIPIMVPKPFLQLAMEVVGPTHILLHMVLPLQPVMVVMDQVTSEGAVGDHLQQDLMVGMVVLLLLGMGALPLVILGAAAAAMVLRRWKLLL